jgi:hypothetical protein
MATLTYNTIASGAPGLAAGAALRAYVTVSSVFGQHRKNSHYVLENYVSTFNSASPIILFRSIVHL